MKFQLLICSFLICAIPINSYSQQDKGQKNLRTLITSGKIKGTIYDDKQLILWLTNKGQTQEYLVDSIFRFNYLNKNKISFFVRFNDVASDTKMAYTEIVLSNQKSKLIFLNDKIDSIRAISSSNSIKVFTRSFTRFDVTNTTVYTITSYPNNFESQLFSYTSKQKTVDLHGQ